MFGLSREAAAPSLLSDRSQPTTNLRPRRTRHITRRLLCVWTILISIPCLSHRASAQEIPSEPFDQTEATAKKGKAKVGPGVEEALAADGSARVIVALQIPASLRRPTRSRFAEIRRDIEAAQNAVLGSLTPGEHGLNRRYSLVPALAATIRSRAVLQRLTDHPLVVGVDLDEEATGGLADSVPLIRADSMHAHGYTGEGIVAAILDSGIDTDHPDLVDDLIHEECFLSDPVCHNGLARDSGPGSAEDDLGHGTHVSGTITSSGTISSVGVAPDVQIVAVKVLAYNNRGWWSDIMAALDWVLFNRPDVDLINMSLGGGLYTGQCDYESSFTVSFASLINALRSVGVTTFVSAGNDSSPSQMEFPACLSGVLSVGATNDFDQVASFSNTNLYTDLVAPGVAIAADVPGGGVGYYSGTSMASPHALGCAALQIEAGRATVPGAIESWLKGSGVPVTDSRNGLTFPRVDCFAEPSYAPPGDLVAAAGPPDGTGGCGGTGAYTLNVIGGTISRTSDTGFNHWAVGYRCWQFDEQYTRVYVVADDPSTFNHWESPSGNIGLIDGHNGTSTTTIETSFNLLGLSPTFEAVHNGGPPTPDLLRVDNLSGTGTIVGPLSGGSSSVYPSVAVHPTTEVMYTGGGDGAAILHTVDKTTGALTPIGAAGSGITRIAAMDFRSDGTLFASVKVSSSGGPGANYLATVNTSTGAATLIGSFGTCTASCSIEGMGAIAFDAGGLLYGALHERAQAGTPGLYTINTSTGAASFVAPIVDGTSTPPSGGITSLQFLDGALYGGTAIAKAPPGDGGWLVAINKTSGVFSKIGLSSATGGRGLVALGVGPPGTPPPNDDLADATAVGSLPYSASGTTENATTEPSEAFGSCAADHGFSIWWSFTAATSDPVDVTTNGSGINTAVSIWTGSGHPLTQLECDDDSGTGSASRIRFDATAGTEYFIRVIGVAGQEGSVNLNVLLPVLPANDDLAGSIPLGAFPSTEYGTNIDATRESLELSTSCAPDVGNSVWWHFTASSNETVILDTKGSNFDTVLGIWTGSGHPLTQVACDDDSGGALTSQISFNAAAGETYRISVHGFNEAEGSIVLNSAIVPGVGCGDQTQIPITECGALVALYDSTGGPTWTDKTGWNATATPCSWFGVTCAGGHVEQISLPLNHLTGPLPDSLENLSMLTKLNLPDNLLSGPIPASIGNLSSLKFLDLSFNSLTDSIPASIGNLDSLQYLRLFYNSLEGPIPDTLGSLVSLKGLGLRYNSLTGSIPESLGNLSTLDYLDLTHNGLTGPIPQSLGNLSALTNLSLSENALTGAIPAALGNLSGLLNFKLEQNNLGGTVPLPVAEVGSDMYLSCDFRDNDPGLCMPDTPEYQALATGGAICGLTLDPECEPLPSDIVDVEIEFAVDMSIEITTGNFDTDLHLVTVAGSHNGWDTVADTLKPDILDPNLYTKLVPIDGVDVSGGPVSFSYKYVTGIKGSSPIGWESVPDRELIVTGGEPDSNSNGYLEVFQDSVPTFDDRTIEDFFGTDMTITFVVDARPPVYFLADSGFVPSDVQTSETVSTWSEIFMNGPLSASRGWDSWGPDELGQIASQKLYDDGTHGDAVAGDAHFSAVVGYSEGESRRGGLKFGLDGYDNESLFGANHMLLLPDVSQGAVAKAVSAATVHLVFGAMENGDGSFQDALYDPYINIGSGCVQVVRGGGEADAGCLDMVDVEAKVFLGGPYAAGAMHANSNFTDHLPSAQPYSNPFFDGTPLNHDNADVVSSLPDSVLDWVLVSLREDVTAASEVTASKRVAFLLANGSLVDTTGGVLAFPGVAPGGYYLVVRHRNHASVMSADTLDLSDGLGTWDFTTSMAQAYSAGGNPMKDLGDGNFGMFACDANADGQVTAPDFNLWNAATTAGATGYEQADCNMDGQVTAPDFNLWNANTTAGASSKVPE